MSIRVNSLLVGVVLGAINAFSGWACAQSPGLAVGETAPDFELQDQNGAKQKLSELLKNSQEDHIALVFYRSADW